MEVSTGVGTPCAFPPLRSHSSPQWEEFRSSVADRKVTAVTGDRVGGRRSLTLQGAVAVCEVSLGLSSVLFSRMREAARKIEEKHFANHATHVEFLPVEWRSKLTLDVCICVYICIVYLHYADAREEDRRDKEL